MSLKTYHLTIVFDDTTDNVEYIEEELSEDASTINPEAYIVDIDPDYYDDELIRKLIEHGIVGES
tara:strand:+ start:186 stop:380 length:195 start_codon:yes stop_codon:yes gene_type:complete